MAICSHTRSCWNNIHLNKPACLEPVAGSFFCVCVCVRTFPGDVFHSKEWISLPLKSYVCHYFQFFQKGYKPGSRGRDRHGIVFGLLQHWLKISVLHHDIVVLNKVNLKRACKQKKDLLKYFDSKYQWVIKHKESSKPELSCHNATTKTI